MVTEMVVDLEDVYIGRSIDFEINRQIVCPSCDGSGAREKNDVIECKVCGGRGIRIIRHQLGPGIFQQMQMQCDECHGHGKTIKHSCPKCSGHQTVDHVNSLTLDLDRGSPDGYEELFEGEGDEGPEIDAGDVVLRIKIRRHEGGFRRVDENLYWRETIDLKQALLGFTRKISHLDGHDLTLNSKSVIQPGFVQVIEGEGMPRHRAMGHGDLFVEYSVVFPVEISGLEKLFGSGEMKLGSEGDDSQSNHATGEL
ncbi:DnaJ C terminal domain-containing protein [Phakopsora pachyrhizi]|nr:DnaJ C terminal domain-containing protein [Phakopsora pachyrhizi]